MRVGFLIETLSVPLTYVQDEVIPLYIIIPVVAGVLLVVVIISLIIICCVVCLYRKKSKKNEQRWTNLLSQMELMELEMADECKRGMCVIHEQKEREREREREETRERSTAC